MAVAFGNNGRFEDSTWVMDTDRNAPAGDLSEQCGNDGVYRIPSSRITSRRINGYCLHLPNSPSAYRVEYSSSLVTQFNFQEQYDFESVSFKLEKTSDFQLEL